MTTVTLRKPGTHLLGRPRWTKENAMRNAVIDYCEEEGLTAYQLFARAYAEHIGHPLGTLQHSTVLHSAQMFMAAKSDTVPSYVSQFLEKQYKRQQELFQRSTTVI